MKIITILLVMVLAAVGASAQATAQPLIPPHALTVQVVLFGHSWIELMQGFQPWAFPNILSGHVSIQGYGGYTCAELLTVMSSSVPATTNAVFITSATNDILENVPGLPACRVHEKHDRGNDRGKLQDAASDLQCSARVFQAGDHRAAIAAYNQAYTTLPPLYPNNVKLVDMWTPMVATNGWGLANMFRADGVHFGTDGQDLVMGTIRDALYSNLPK
jgi:lysophospholipase L1-like esterase